MPLPVHETIANAVKAGIDALSISGMTCTVRAEVYRTEADVGTIALVTMGEDRDRQFFTGGNVLRDLLAILAWSISAVRTQTSVSSCRDASCW
jgi:hypothetical protein